MVRRPEPIVRVGAKRVDAEELASFERVDCDVLRGALRRMFPEVSMLTMLTAYPSECKITMLPPKEMAEGFARLRDGLQPGEDLRAITSLLLVMQRHSAIANRLNVEKQQPHMLAIEVRG